MINQTDKVNGLKHTTFDDVYSKIPDAQKKSLPSMGEASECHMEALFKPNTFEHRLEKLSRPIIQDVYLLNPSEFKRIGKEALVLLQAQNDINKEILDVLSLHQNDEAILNTLRHLLIEV